VEWGGKPVVRNFGMLLLFAVPWYWLFKLVAFDYTSTDNISELLEPPGAIGIGGGIFLFLLIFLIAFNATSLAFLHRF